MIEKIINKLANRIKYTKTLSGQKTNQITAVDHKGICVETESSREKYRRGERPSLTEEISHHYILQGWEEFISKRIATANDFIKVRGRSSFIMSYFAQLPFVEVSSLDNKTAIKLKEFQTDDLPSEQYHKVKAFLDEVINGTYDPKTLSNQVDGNLYRIKSRGRQDARLLGFVNEFNENNKSQFEAYQIAEDKDGFIKRIIMNQGYFRVALISLDLLRNLPKRDKKAALEELGMLIVRNSRGDNLMVESVAKERTNNLLMWLQSTYLIDNNWNPTENYFDTLNSKEQVMSSNLREMLLEITNQYLSAKREPIGGHPLGPFVRNEVTEEINNLPFIDPSEYIVTGSVGQGNWAAVPWIAIMNRKITVSTQRGYYIVYLLSEDMQNVYLTLAQGVTETSKEDMLRIKGQIRESIPGTSKVKVDDDISLGESKKARDYALSTAAYIHYPAADMPEENIMINDLEEMIHIYENFISINEGTVYDNEQLQGETQVVKENRNTYLPSKDIIDHIYFYIKNKGFYYRKEEVINLYLSLKTKPFVILSGISGTGKTKMVQWFAESLGANEKNGQFTLIPVRPDWSDGSDLLGYVDIKGDFKEGPLTKAIKAAQEQPDLPYFVLLDEMNLARVEYYFSDILSVMESRRWENGQVVSSVLLSEEVAKEEVTLPNNLYVIGTVNMDETTHPFSKKVLDRANTIEFNRVELDNLSFLQDLEDVDPVEIGQTQLASNYLHLKDLYKEDTEVIEKATSELVRINKSLQLINAHIGYRVRDEICFYLAYNKDGDLMTFEEAFDHCILQKILPRLSGSDSRIDQLLRELYLIFTNTEYQEDEVSQFDEESAIYPKSARKVIEMLRRLKDDGFTSFWIS
ncbi:restriction endonuclease [Bacillus sp. OG2]|nr:restriction endonuclease [Bacillus sp. OG2]